MRLVISAVIGFAAGILAPLDDPMLRILAGWNTFGWLYIVLVVTMTMRAELEGIKRQAKLGRGKPHRRLAPDPVRRRRHFPGHRGPAFGAHARIGRRRTVTFALSFSTIFVSWLLVQIAYTLYYAHEFHSESRKPARGAGGGLRFPNDSAPDYLDFLHFAFCVGTTMQTSDVAITARHMRRRVTVHGLLAFIFNMLVIALMVNLTAQLVQG